MKVEIGIWSYLALTVMVYLGLGIVASNIIRKLNEILKTIKQLQQDKS